jgi:hypothetical protein
VFPALGTASHATLYRRWVSPTPQELLRPERIGTRDLPSLGTGLPPRIKQREHPRGSQSGVREAAIIGPPKNRSLITGSDESFLVPDKSLPDICFWPNALVRHLARLRQIQFTCIGGWSKGNPFSTGRRHEVSDTSVIHGRPSQLLRVLARLDGSIVLPIHGDSLSWLTALYD